MIRINTNFLLLNNLIGTIAIGPAALSTLTNATAPTIATTNNTRITGFVHPIVAPKFNANKKPVNNTARVTTPLTSITGFVAAALLGRFLAIKKIPIASGSTGVYVGGNKVWPCQGYTRISSGYGPRNTGIPGASTNHKGIDIGCPTGTPILSVLDGKVIFTGYNAYRGYYIMVDHGGGVVTLYQHCKGGSYKVSVGDKVKAGQTIILSGSSGIGSGPHLHFEVLINGSNVNPLTWLKQ